MEVSVGGVIHDSVNAGEGTYYPRSHETTLFKRAVLVRIWALASSVEELVNRRELAPL